MYIAVRGGKVKLGEWHSGISDLIETTIVHMDYFRRYELNEAHIILYDAKGRYIGVVALTEGGIAFERYKRMYLREGSLVLELDV